MLVLFDERVAAMSGILYFSFIVGEAVTYDVSERTVFSFVVM